jgi:hypothetical protein
MKKAILFATTLALALGARAQTVNPVGSTFASDDGTVSPPIVITGPSAPKKPGPVVHYSQVAQDSGTISLPIIVIPPSAPKKPGPVAQYVAENGGNTLPPVVAPSVPKRWLPGAHLLGEHHCRQRQRVSDRNQPQRSEETGSGCTLYGERVTTDA